MDGKKILFLGAFLFSYMLFALERGLGIFGQAYFGFAGMAVFAALSAVSLFFLNRTHGIWGVAAALALFAVFEISFSFGFPFLEAGTLFFLGLFPFYYYGISGKNFSAISNSLGFPGKVGIREILLGLGGTFALFLVAAIVSLLLYAIFGIQDQGNVVEKIRGFSPFLLLAAVFISPLAEEVFFRGFLLREVGELPSSLVFALLHFSYGSIAEVFAAFFLGLALCRIAKISGGLFSPILSHSLFNLASVSYAVFFS